MEQETIKCPKCGSAQITANQKGFSGGKAVAGAVLTGGIGLLGGLHGKNDIVITCLACGNTWAPGEVKPVKKSHPDEREEQIIAEYLKLGNVIGATKYIKQVSSLNGASDIISYINYIREKSGIPYNKPVVYSQEYTQAKKVRNRYYAGAVLFGAATAVNLFNLMNGNTRGAIAILWGAIAVFCYYKAHTYQMPENETTTE